MTNTRILGLSASLRHARSKIGCEEFVREITALECKDELIEYLGQQAKIHLDQFVESGRADGKPFDELYRELRRLGGHRGLSNSEVCIAAALWSAKDLGSEVDYVALGDHFPADGKTVDIDQLSAKLEAADAIVLGSPVYFGDRSSVCQRFIEMLRADDELRACVRGKIHSAVAVGAKRNGGQETTLIYEMMDMLQIGMVAVGNDSDTTSQYGGTGHAGDIGTMPQDLYGIDTSMGVGRRIARASTVLSHSADARLADQVRVGLWVLQDRENTVRRVMEPFLGDVEFPPDVDWLDLLQYDIRPCIACDICPTHVGPDEEYRCIIARRDDGMKQMHEDLLWPDILMPAVYAPLNRGGLESVYQTFMERTRYLRRGDYPYTDRLVAPIVVTEIGANEHMDIRMVTSFIRHHTVMHRPIIAWLRDGEVINPEEVAADLQSVLQYGTDLCRGRLAAAHLAEEATQYHPVGYVLSSEKDKERSTMTAREKATEERNARLIAESRKRLESVDKTVVAAK